MSSYVVAVEGLSSLSDIQNLDENILLRARQAINRTTERARTRSDKEMRKQIAFPARYLSSRLTVSKKASGRNLQAVITGRDRPTSLARFAKNKDVSSARRKGGVSVTVSPGQTRFMGGAFLMQLRGGNLGLAIRLKQGQSLRNKRKLASAGKGLYILYGPSVDQVFRSVADEYAAPDAADFLEREFLRLMEL